MCPHSLKVWKWTYAGALFELLVLWHDENFYPAVQKSEALATWSSGNHLNLTFLEKPCNLSKNDSQGSKFSSSAGYH